MELFLRNNPWKFSQSNRTQKNFRYCIACGNDRFKETWKGALGYLAGKPPTICDNRLACWDKLDFVPTSIMKQYFLAAGQSETDPAQEQFLDIPDTVVAEDERVFDKPDVIPEKYKEIISRLEQYPCWNRDQQIWMEAKAYADKYGRQADFFLIFLEGYRQRTLEKHKEISSRFLRPQKR